MPPPTLRDKVGQCAGRTHPTGMHSCLANYFTEIAWKRNKLDRGKHGFADCTTTALDWNNQKFN